MNSNFSEPVNIVSKQFFVFLFLFVIPVTFNFNLAAHFDIKDNPLLRTGVQLKGPKNKIY